jgi:hypothetical protein
LKPESVTRKIREYLKHIINELVINSKNKEIRDLHRAVNKYGSNLVKDENAELLADSHKILGG